MRLSPAAVTARHIFFFISSLVALLPFSHAERVIESKSLYSCMDNSSFSASTFSVVFTPDNNTLTFDIVGVTSISGNVTAELQVIAYGYKAMTETLDPCSMDLDGMCPMNTGQIDITSNLEISDELINQIPNIAYTVPDLDGKVKIYINSSDTGKVLACVEADLSNGKTVYQSAVGWATAVIAGLGLASSAIVSGLGHSNTAAHIAANALSLFGFFQAQAFVGMTSVSLPPIVASWTQNFQWSMGLIDIGFVQDIATWYQRATGGTPSTTLSTLSTESVQVEKRFLRRSRQIAKPIFKMANTAVSGLLKRTHSSSSTSETTDTIIVRGIKRVGFRANIETTNIFMTGLIFFVLFIIIISVGVTAFKYGCELIAKTGQMKSSRFQDFRNGWKVVLKGILFRIILIGYPQMCVLCLWELVERDSAAEIVLAVCFFFIMSGSLGWAAFRVIRIAQRSMALHKNPAYILYSDPSALNKWGFLYVQFRATAYYFICPVLGHILMKSLFIAFGQSAGTVQAVGLVVVEAINLIGVSVLRPYMDKKTNTFNIAISAMNFLNVIFLLVFADIFDQPGIVTGVVGVIFFIINCVFATVLLVTVLLASGFAVFSKNPDNRYQPMRDDRGSFIKSSGGLTTELDALGATARGDYKRRDLDEDESISTDSIRRSQQDNSSLTRPPTNPPPSHSPVDPSVPLFPSENPSRATTATNPTFNQTAQPSKAEPNNMRDPRTMSMRSDLGADTDGPNYDYQQGAYEPGGYSSDRYSHSGYSHDYAPGYSQQPGYQQQQYQQQQQYGQQYGQQPYQQQWQRGAGYG